MEIQPPELRIIPLEKILPHEEFDSQRALPLMQRIAQADSWLHPPIVTPLPDSDDLYILLDGTNRCYSLQELGFPHILVQVVSYYSGQVELDTWNHVISQVNVADVLPDIAAIEHIEVEETNLLSAQAALAQRDGLAYLIDLVESRTLLLHIDSHAAETRSACLRALVSTYKQKGILNRLNTADIEIMRQTFPDATTLVVFPQYQPAEILTAARDHYFLPPGISRHVIHGRALRLNYPLEQLRDKNIPLEIKNQHLQNWVQERYRQRNVRFYAEATFIFDE